MAVFPSVGPVAVFDDAEGYPAFTSFPHPLMVARQAKPDDVFTFVSPREIRELWPRLERYLGRSRSFWTWLFERWDAQGRSFR
jgi:hypothetical protein